MNNIKTIFIDGNKFKLNPNYYTQLINQILPFDTLDCEDIYEQLQKGTYYYILIADERVASICRVIKLSKSTYINSPIVTDDKYQGKGYATKCMIGCERQLKKRGCKKLISFVDDENIASYNLHIKVGYTRIKDCDKFKDIKYYWDTAIVFEKVLNKQKIQENLIIKR